MTDDQILNIADKHKCWGIGSRRQDLIPFARELLAAAPQAGTEPGPPLTDFKEGQWWVAELDALASAPGTTPDQKRAVAVVHRLLQAIQTQTNPTR